MRNVVHEDNYQCDEAMDTYIDMILIYELIFTGGYFVTILYNVFTNILDIKFKSKIGTLEQTLKKNLTRKKTSTHNQEELKIEWLLYYLYV